MENGRKGKEIINQMSLPMANPPISEMRGFPYYAPEFQNMNNYQQMGIYNGYPPMNGYPQQMSLYQEEALLDPLNRPENVSTPKNQNNPSANSEKTKIKPYINLLITTVTNLLNEGKITMKYLKEKTENKLNGKKSNGINSSEQSYSPSIKTLGSSSRSNKEKKNIIYDNQSNYNKKGGNTVENFHCENPLCKNAFNSNKEKTKIKIKGLKIQEKKLCKKCCDSVEKEHFCYYCNTIYRDDKIDNAKWIECDFCGKWEHFDCEISKGKRYANVQELNDAKQYMCPCCVNKRVEQTNNDIKLQKKLINKKRRGDTFDDQKCKKNQRKDLRNLKSEKCSELLDDIQLIDSLKNSK